MKIQWTKADEHGVVRAHNVPGLEIVKDTFHDGERQRVEYMVAIGEEWPVVRARTRDQAKGFVQGIVEAVTAVHERPCDAVIHHGPGHQSTSTCEVRGEHDVHGVAVMGQMLEWRGSEGMTGFFDESPLDDDEG